MKLRRQSIIRKLVAGDGLRTHVELQDRLRDAGIEATQPTLSRDLRELGILRGHVRPPDSWLALWQRMLYLVGVAQMLQSA